MDQRRTPYLDALVRLAETNPGRFHIPGHKGGAGADPGLRDAIGDAALRLDFPSGVEGVDIGADPFENHTTTVVVRKGGGIGANYMTGLTAAGSAQITLKFDDQAPRGRWTAQRSVSLEKLKPGTYTLEITVTAANGIKDVRRRSFRVVN